MPHQSSPWYRRMRSRERGEEHRASTPLELLFDLCFVVAIGTNGAHLHHALLQHDPVHHAVLPYLLQFFAIWWAWMNFTWFASAYDTDDVPYRLAVLIQIAGVLVLTAGVPREFDSGDTSVVTLGYTIMRVGLVSLWLRAARSDVDSRPTALRQAIGILVLAVGWGLLLLVPHALRTPGFIVMVLAEMSLPMWSERFSPTQWHPEHIAERYGLFTLIVLGETVLSAATAVQAGLVSGAPALSLWLVAGSGLVIVFAIWWLYFDRPAERLIRHTTAFLWGYGHYFIFAAAAALGAGLGVVVDYAHGSSAGHVLSRAGASATVTVPVAVLLLAVWFLHVRPHYRRHRRHYLLPLAAVLVLAATAVPPALVVTAAIMGALVTVWVWINGRQPT